MLKVLGKVLLDTDFTPDLPHFLHNIVGAQLNIGGAQALPKKYKVTPMLEGNSTMFHFASQEENSSVFTAGFSFPTSPGS